MRYTAIHSEVKNIVLRTLAQAGSRAEQFFNRKICVVKKIIYFT